VHTELSAEQLVMVKEMRREMQTFAAGTQITAVNGADKIGKLRQIMGGSIKDPDGGGSYITVGAPERVRTLRGLIAEATAKVLVIVPFTGMLNFLAKELAKPDGEFSALKVLVLNGAVTGSKRDAVIKSFREDPEYQVMVCHPAVTAHGHDFSVADTTIFYAPIYSNDQYTQVIERFSGMAQKNTMFLFRVLAHPLEASIYRVVDDRGAAQNSILELYREFIKTEDDHL
jgi:SNF2 family DNA or RNA helicase